MHILGAQSYNMDSLNFNSFLYFKVSYKLKLKNNRSNPFTNLTTYKFNISSRFEQQSIAEYIQTTEKGGGGILNNLLLTCYWVQKLDVQLIQVMDMKEFIR